MQDIFEAWREEEEAQRQARLRRSAERTDKGADGRAAKPDSAGKKTGGNAGGAGSADKIAAGLTTKKSTVGQFDPANVFGTLNPGWSKQDFEDFRMAFTGDREEDAAQMADRANGKTFGSATRLPTGGVGRTADNTSMQSAYNAAFGIPSDAMAAKLPPKLSTSGVGRTIDNEAMRSAYDAAFGITDPSMMLMLVDGKLRAMPRSLFGDQTDAAATRGNTPDTKKNPPDLDVISDKTNNMKQEAEGKITGKSFEEFKRECLKKYVGEHAGVEKNISEQIDDLHAAANLARNQPLLAVGRSYGAMIDSLSDDAITLMAIRQEIERRKHPELYPEPQVETFNVYGNEYWMDMANESGIGVLPDGQVIIGKNVSEKEVENFKKWMNGETVPIKDNEGNIIGEKDYNIRDFTEYLDDFMDKRSRQFEYISTLPRAVQYALFILTEMSNSVGDLKTYPEIRKHDLVIYNGEIMNKDALGNIAYGSYSKDFGLSKLELIAGAGAAQIFSGNTKLEWYPTLFDDPRDTRRVWQGIARWEDQWRKKRGILEKSGICLD